MSSRRYRVDQELEIYNFRVVPELQISKEVVFFTIYIYIYIYVLFVLISIYFLLHVQSYYYFSNINVYFDGKSYGPNCSSLSPI